MSALIELPTRSEYTLPSGRLSWSQVALYSQCPACYSAAYVEQRPEPKVSISLPMGGAVHHGVAEARRRRMGGAQTLLPVTYAEMAVEHYRQQLELRDADTWELGTKWADLQAPESKVADMTAAAVAGLVLKEQNIIAVEEEIDFEGCFPFAFQGFADVVLRRPDGVEQVRELKTAADLRLPDQMNASQLALYGLPRHRRGQLVSAGLDTVTKSKKPEVRSLDLPLSEREFDAVYWMVMLAAEGISRGYFPPRPGILGCRYDHGLPSFSLPVSGFEETA